MRQKGDAYEDIVEFIYRVLLRDYRYLTIERNVFVQTRLGPVEIDIYCRGEIAGHPISIAISCKDQKRKVDAPILRDFYQGLLETRASKGIIVSKSGFTAGAIKRAHEYAIDLRRASKITEATVADFAAVPIRIIQHTVTAIAPTFRAGPSSPKSIDIDNFLCGKTTEELLATGLMKSALKDLRQMEFMGVSKNFEAHGFNRELNVGEVLGIDPLWVRDTNGSKHIIKEAVLYLALDTKEHLKSLSSLEGAYLLEHHDANEVKIVVPASSVRNILSDSPAQAPTFALSPVAEIEAIFYDRSKYTRTMVELVRGA